MNIKISELNSDRDKGLLEDVTADELQNLRGGDGLGAIVGYSTGVGVGIALSGSDPVKTIQAGVAGGSAGNLIPALLNPTVGIPAAALFGGAAGAAAVLSGNNNSISDKFTPSANPAYTQFV